MEIKNILWGKKEEETTSELGNSGSFDVVNPPLEVWKHNVATPCINISKQ